MNYITYIIVALIPAAAITIVVYLYLKKSSQREITALSLNMKKERQKYFLEPRMEAYQRMILLLERISPSSLTMRLFNPKKSALEMHQDMLQTIRKEFDHNVAQQLFISLEGWDLVKKSKEESIKIINVAAKQIEDKGTAEDLSNKILEIVSELDEQPTDIASKLLKREFQKLF